MELNSKITKSLVFFCSNYKFLFLVLCQKIIVQARAQHVKLSRFTFDGKENKYSFTWHTNYIHIVHNQYKMTS